MNRFFLTLKHFFILKCKESLPVLILIGLAILFMIPGLIIILRFMPDLVKDTSTAPLAAYVILMVIMGALLSAVFYLVIMLLYLLSYAIFNGIKEIKKRKFKILTDFLKVCVEYKFNVIVSLSPFPVGYAIAIEWLKWTKWLKPDLPKVSKFIALSLESWVVGAVILVVGFLIYVFLFHVQKFIRSNWTQAKRLADEQLQKKPL